MKRDIILALAFAISMVALGSYSLIQVSETKQLLLNILNKGK
jgi:hypothetical protein